MSRTIRIKNNYRETECTPYCPRDVGLYWQYDWVDGDEIGKDPNFSYCIKVALTDKTQLWKERKWFHTDGKAYASHGNVTKGMYHYFNRMDRHIVNTSLRDYVKGCANDDTYDMPPKKKLPWAYF